MSKRALYAVVGRRRYRRRRPRLRRRRRCHRLQRRESAKTAARDKDALKIPPLNAHRPTDRHAHATAIVRFRNLRADTLQHHYISRSAIENVTDAKYIWLDRQTFLKKTFFSYLHIVKALVSSNKMLQSGNPVQCNG
jgi:hypothetical protein